MITTRVRAALAVLPLAAAGALASVSACSGSTGNASAPATSTTAPRPTVSVTPEGSLVLPEEPSTGGLGECAQLGAEFTALVNRTGLLSIGGSDADYDKLAAQAADMRARMPTDLQQRFAVIDRAIGAIIAKAKGADLKTADGAKRLAEATELFGAQDLRDANRAIEQWFRTNCEKGTEATTPFTTPG